MTGATDVLSSRFKQLAGGIARIGTANGLSVLVDCFRQFECVGEFFPEHRMQKLNDEYERSFIVVVKGYLEVAGLGVNIVHGVNIPWCAVISASRCGSRLS
jgi:hypothetical protein